MQRLGLQTLKTKSDPMKVRINWDVIDPYSVSAVDHSKLAGLQIADAVASSFYYAVNLNRYREIEDKYARLLLPNCYRHKGIALGYGLKFWPEELQKLKSANPHIAIFAEEDKL